VEPTDTDAPLIRIQRRSSSDYILVERDGPTESWLEPHARYSSWADAEDAIRAAGRTQAIECPECRGTGHVEITERCPRCEGRAYVTPPER
jgi:hypothetical protein